MQVRLLILLMLCAATTGCQVATSALHNTCFEWTRTYSDFQEDWSLKHQANAAWDGAKVSCPCTSHDFADGFKDGYIDFLKYGGNGKAPYVPPRKYWHARFRTPEGYLAASEWFAGFSHGSAAARQSNGRQWNVLPSRCAVENGGCATCVAGSPEISPSGLPPAVQPPPTPLPTPLPLSRPPEWTPPPPNQPTGRKAEPSAIVNTSANTSAPAVNLPQILDLPESDQPVPRIIQPLPQIIDLPEGDGPRMPRIETPGGSTLAAPDGPEVILIPQPNLPPLQTPPQLPPLPTMLPDALPMAPSPAMTLPGLTVSPAPATDAGPEMLPVPESVPEKGETKAETKVEPTTGTTTEPQTMTPAEIKTAPAADAKTAPGPDTTPAATPMTMPASGATPETTAVPPATPQRVRIRFKDIRGDE